MPVLRIKVNGEWVELPALQGPPGELSKAVADTLYAAFDHDHNALYYTKAEVDVLTASTGVHDHDDRYYTKAEVDTSISDLDDAIAAQMVAQSASFNTALSGKANTSHTHTSAQVTGVFTASQIPSLDATKITSGVLAAARIPVLGSANVAGLDAADVTSGTFGSARIPNMDASKITTGTLSAARIPVLGSANIGGLDAADIVSGTLSASRIPILNTNYITSGVFAAARIPKGMEVIFANNGAISATGSRLLRVGPHNDHASIATAGNWSVHDTGYRRTTDESWGYIMVPGLGFLWAPASIIS